MIRVSWFPYITTNVLPAKEELGAKVLLGHSLVLQDSDRSDSCQNNVLTNVVA